MGVTKSAAWDCAEHRIHVNAICPGCESLTTSFLHAFILPIYIDTATALTRSVFDNDEVKTRIEAMHPFRGLGEAEDIARVAVFLASEDAGWITGVGLPVDGGYNSF